MGQFCRGDTRQGRGGQRDERSGPDPRGGPLLADGRSYDGVELLEEGRCDSRHH